MRTSVFKEFPIGYPDQDNVLDYGELFVELPVAASDNIRIKIGDGKRKYKDLPYRLGDTSTDELYFTESEEKTLNNALSKVTSGADVATSISNLKKAIQLTAKESGYTTTISDEYVDVDTTTKKITTMDEALKLLTEKEPLSIVLGTLTQAIEITFNKEAETGNIDIAVQTLSKIGEDTSTTVDEALDKVKAGNQLGDVLGALKNAIGLVDKESSESIKDVSTSVINYTDSTDTSVKEALDKTKSGNKLQDVVAGLKQAVNLIQNASVAKDVSDTTVHIKKSDAETREEAIDQIDAATEMDSLMGAIKKAIELTDSTSDFGEETEALAAKKLNASLRGIMSGLETSNYQGTEEVADTEPTNNAVDSKEDIAFKEVFFKDSKSTTEQDALNEVSSGAHLSEIIAGLKQAIVLVNNEIKISNMQVDYIDDQSTSIEAVSKNARSGNQLKIVIAALERSIQILDQTDKELNNKIVQSTQNIGKYRVSFKENNDNSIDKINDSIVTGTDLSSIVANLKRSIAILNKKSNLVQKPNLNAMPLSISAKGYTSATSAANNINSGITTADAISCIKQAILILDQNKASKSDGISDKQVIFTKNTSSTRNMALQSVFSGNSLSSNIAALKRAIELTDDGADVSDKTVNFVDDNSQTIDEALAKVRSGGQLKLDIASLKKAIELISDKELKHLDISSKTVNFVQIITGTASDNIANIKSGDDLSTVISYIKKVLMDQQEKISSLEKQNAVLSRTLAEMINKESAT